MSDAAGIPDGLPGPLPAGERLLWQGKPSTRPFTREVFRLRWLTVYFLVLLAWPVSNMFGTDDDRRHALVGFGAILIVAGAAWAVLLLLGWLMARSTVYTITDRRVVLRIGVALPTTVNLPFAKIASADLLRRDDGSGDIPLTLSAGNKIGIVHLWPHARPWHFNQPQPMLRAIAEPERVAALLASALVAAHGGGGAQRPVVAPETAWAGAPSQAVAA